MAIVYRITKINEHWIYDPISGELDVRSHDCRYQWRDDAVAGSSWSDKVVSFVTADGDTNTQKRAAADAAVQSDLPA